MPETLPARIGRYEIESELGRGMMGVVYRAHDPELGRTVALKTVSLAFAVSETDRESFRRRFLEEARIAARLSHPGIVVVHEVGKDDGTGALFIVLEYLRGRTLADLMGAGALPWREALGLVFRVARALHHAHQAGIVHRDVKPANIMVLESGEPKILDFGVAKAPASQLTAAGQFFGTPAYMAPEQIGGHPVDARTDIFALGCVLYQALTARRPFEGENVARVLARVLQDEPTAPSRLVAGLPVAVDAVVAHALAKDPDQRYPRASDLADDLEAVLDGGPLVHAVAVERPGGATLASTRGVPMASRAGRAAESPADNPLVDLLEPEPPRPRRPAKAWLVALGGLVLLGAAAGLFSYVRARSPASDPERPASTQDDSAPAAPGGLSRLWQKLQPPKPAQLSVDFEHHLKSGTLQVWVDDELVVEEAVEGRVTEKILSFRLRRGTTQQTLEVEPGRHEIRVQVSWDGGRRTGRAVGEFEAGSQRRLGVTVGLLRRNLSLEWK